MNNLGYGVWAYAAGALIPLVGILNAGLSRALGGPFYASFFVMLSGAVAMGVVALLAQGAPPALYRYGDIQPQHLIAGLIMAFYIGSITWLAPRFGVGNAILLVVTAQICTAAIIDNFALFGAPHKPLTWLRASGLVLVIAGLAITQLAASRR
ncbi:DMT family transporter [Hankyongella ginsenosidimutans]|uniref:DMT family transporter n=1 Tax=Hankyongella ginsenosidimutans TaxID=1763828 RepID=A0A4D7C699_9SPHN|nr:DMT family transporter [Hankyongella ginsenosidimutans]QCI79310.1 DMT family transporter [Hankyongella ginsenosidimutans]